MRSIILVVIFLLLALFVLEPPTVYLRGEDTVPLLGPTANHSWVSCSSGCTSTIPDGFVPLGTICASSVTVGDRSQTVMVPCNTSTRVSP